MANTCEECQTTLDGKYKYKANFHCPYCNAKLRNSAPLQYLVLTAAGVIALVTFFPNIVFSGNPYFLGSAVGILAAWLFLSFFGFSYNSEAGSADKEKLDEVLLRRQRQQRKSAKDIAKNIDAYRSKEALRKANKRWWEFWI